MAAGKRNTGIDLLRILSTMMVVVMHILYNGGVLANTIARPPQYRTAWLLELMSYGCVNCFALITGYHSYGRKTRLSSLAAMWLRVLWYSLGITAVFAVIRPGSAAGMWLQSCFPLTHGMYWYFSSYVMAMLLMPLINRELAGRSAKAHGLFAGMLLAPVMISSMATQEDPFGMFQGFSAMWLLLLGLLGGWLKRVEAEKRIHPAAALGGYLLCTLLAWGEKLLRTERLGAWPWDFDGLFIHYTSFTTVGTAVFLLLLFAGLKLPERLGRIITWISVPSFSVYIIHTHPMMTEHLLTGVFAGWSAMSPLKLTACVCGAAAGVYLLFALIDLPREVLFRRLRVRERLEKLSDGFVKPKAEM